MIRSSYDVVVVGARVAGAATGMLLARAGLDVLVVDRAGYGTDILSTHALMRGGVLQLARWGVLDDVIAAGTPVIRRTVVRYGEREETIAITPRPGYDGLYAPRRFVLDTILADRAAAAGAQVRFGVRVTDLVRDRSGVVAGVVVTDRAGVDHTIRTPLVIGADGARSHVARAVRAPVTGRGRYASAFLVAWYSDVEADGYQWLYGHAPNGEGRSAGIIPTNGGQVCAWVGLPSTGFARRRPEQHVDDIFAQIAPDWAARLAAGRRHGPVRGFPGFPGWVRRPYGDGWALVGDAGYFKDPLSTHGMTDALRDAELLAGAVVASSEDPSSRRQALASYASTRDRLSLPLFRRSDRVCAYDWSLAELRELLLGVSAAMRDEVEHLSALDTAPALAGAAT